MNQNEVFQDPVGVEVPTLKFLFFSNTVIHMLTKELKKFAQPITWRWVAIPDF